jgi:membrane protease YdiL (CAAX protease family)
MSLPGVGQPPQRLWPEVSGWRALLSATLVGLSWFPLKLGAILIGNFIASSLILHTSHPTAAQLTIFSLYTDLAMLLVSGIFCFLLIPKMFRITPQRYREFLQEIGVTGGSWRAIVAILGLMGLVGIFLLLFATPLVWHSDVSAWVSFVQPPLVEETLFRGIVLALLLRRFPVWFAVGWAALLFMPPHVFEGVLVMVGTGLLFGIPQGLLRLRTQSIWPGVIAHFLFVSGIGSPIFLAYVVLIAGLLVAWMVQAGRQRTHTNLKSMARG